MHSSFYMRECVGKSYECVCVALMSASVCACVCPPVPKYEKVSGSPTLAYTP